MGGKAQASEVTVFGEGAKAYISGLTEGQITGKGYLRFGLDRRRGPHNDQRSGRATNMCILFSPTGATAPGTRAVISEAAETDYSISTPVSGVVATNFTAQADSGLSTGVILHDPTGAAIATITTTNDTGQNDNGQSDAPATTLNAAREHDQRLDVDWRRDRHLPVHQLGHGGIRAEWVHLDRDVGWSRHRLLQRSHPRRLRFHFQQLSSDLGYGHHGYRWGHRRPLLHQRRSRRGSQRPHLYRYRHPDRSDQHSALRRQRDMGHAGRVLSPSPLVPPHPLVLTVASSRPSPSSSKSFDISVVRSSQREPPSPPRWVSARRGSDHSVRYFSTHLRSFDL